MRTYEKPMMMVEKFHAENAVAAGCYEQGYTTIGKQTVKCIIEGYETVYDTSNGCSGGSGQFGYYNGQLYYVWYTGTNSYKPTDDQTALLSAIESAVGYGNAGEMGWHAGTVSYESYTAMNMIS